MEGETPLSLTAVTFQNQYLIITTKILHRPNRKSRPIIKQKTLFNKSNTAEKVKYLFKTHSFSLSKPQIQNYCHPLSLPKPLISRKHEDLVINYSLICNFIQSKYSLIFL